MLTLNQLMNPNMKDEHADLSLHGETPISEIDPEHLKLSSEQYISICDAGGRSVGAVKKERLVYLIEKQRACSFIKILDSLDTGIVIIDETSRIYYANAAYAKILGVDIAKVLGRYMNVIEPGAALLNVLETGREMSIDVQLIKSLNTYVSAKMYPIYENGRIAGAYSVFIDITDVNKLHSEVQRMSAVAEEYSRQIQAKEFLSSQHIIGEDKKYIDCISKALKVADTDATVLLRGENGAGKEVLVNLMKQKGPRRDKPFIAVNCSAIPETLIESELFGYEEGAFTGSVKNGKMGKFQLADGGTIFLDEIGDMPYGMQAKLLRVLQEGEIEKVGRRENIPIDVRVIAATNRPLEQMVEAGNFREDLYYRLDVISIKVPPLRERGNDVLLLADFFLEKYCEKYGRSLKMDRRLYQAFMKYNWPGNVRELQNVIESAVVLCEGDSIKLSDLPERVRCLYGENYEERIFRDGERQSFRTLREEVEDFEKNAIMRALKRNQGSRKRTIEELGMTERTFYRKTAIYGIKLK